MSNLSAGQIAGGVIGAAIGFFTGTGPIGAFKGAVIGMSIGGYINPPPGPTIRAPTLDDISYQSSAYGVPLRRVYGQIAMSGNIIYLENNKYKAVQKSKDVGGKGGGGQTVITTTYYATFAVALSEAYPNSIVKRIWAGGKLIFSPDTAPSKKFTFRYYDGTQTVQDPRMASVLGNDNCPTYEGTAYIMFYDFELTEYGNGLAGCPIKVEIAESSGETIETLSQYEIKQIKTFFAPAAPLENPAVSVPITAGYVSGFYSNDFGAKKHYFAYGNGAVFQNSPNILAQLIPVHCDSTGISGNNIVWAYVSQTSDPIITTGIYTNLGYFLSPFFNPGLLTVRAVISFSGNHYGIYQVISSPVLGLPANTVFLAKLGAASYSVVLETLAGSVAVGGFAITTNRLCYFRNSGSFNSNRLIEKRISDGALLSDTPINLPLSSGHSLAANNFSEIYGNKIYTYNLLPPSNIVLITVDLGDYSIDALSFPIDLTFADIILNEASINIGVYFGQIALSFRLFSVLGLRRIQFVIFEKITATTSTIGRVPVMAIVEKELALKGFTSADYDLSQIASLTTIGYAVTQVSSIRASLGPLVSAYLFDLVEIGYKIVAVRRDNIASTVIPYRDLILDESGVVKSRVDSKVLIPSRMTINYIDPQREYETGSQYADYPAAYDNPVVNDLPVVMLSDEAIKLADIFIKTARFELRKYQFSLSQKYLFLNISDIISVEVYPGKYIQFRIDQRNQTLSNTLQLNCSPTTPLSYASDAVGVPGNAGDQSTIPEYAAPIPFVLDIPMIVNEQDIYGITATVAQSPPTTQSALVVSPNNGITFNEIGRFDGPGTIGQVLSDTLIDGDQFVTERGTDLVINNMINGDFFSVTYDQMLRNNNMVAYGQPGRWEIMLYQDATPGIGNEITLSTFIRGMYGTEQYMGTHEAGDFIIQLDDPNTIFAPLPAQAFGQSWPIKAINVGDDTDGGVAANYGTYMAVNLKPLSVVNGSAEKSGNDWLIDFDPRTRYESTQWVTGALEQTDTQYYSVDVFNGVNIVRTIQELNIPIVYTEAQQVADFGAPQSDLTIDIYQVNQRVGRGYPLRVTT